MLVKMVTIRCDSNFRDMDDMDLAATTRKGAMAMAQSLMPMLVRQVTRKPTRRLQSPHGLGTSLAPAQTGPRDRRSRDLHGFCAF